MSPAWLSLIFILLTKLYTGNVIAVGGINNVDISITLTTGLNLNCILATTYADMEIMIILNKTEIPATLKLLKKYLIIFISAKTPTYPSKQSAFGSVNPGSANGSAFKDEIATQMIGNREITATAIITI